MNATATTASKPPARLVLRYDHPAPDSIEGWEQWSLPIGCGYLGANIFGRGDRERIQITENSLANPYKEGLNNFAELYIDFGHDEVTDYQRELCLDDATTRVGYCHRGIHYERELFASYPDRVLAMRLTADRPGSVTFTLRPEIPYLKDYGTTPGDGRGKSGSVHANGDTLTLNCHMDFFAVDCEGQLKVITSGGSSNHDADSIHVANADSVLLLFAVASNYRLEPRVFLEHDPKQKLAPYPHPHDAVTAIMKAATAKSYEELRDRHCRDYQQLFSRVTIDLGGRDDGRCTDALLAAYRAGEAIPWLEQLYFHYGRYLLICSSRPGTLPTNLQGIWNVHDQSPWSAGYWHNINVQMNYWPVFNTNLAELFQSYVDYNEAFRPQARHGADDYIGKHNPTALAPAGENGWTVGTGCWPYITSAPGGHSGPGTGGLTTKLFWDYYDFTRDEQILRLHSFPAVADMARFLCKVLKPVDDLLLSDPSASPEQRHDGAYWQSVGCAFDQQMIWENHHDTIQAAAALDVKDPIVDTARAQLPKLDPVQVGESGQIKEYREEKYYGEIGEYQHRHISQLVGLYPGTLICADTPAWLDAARVSLRERGDKSTGWAMAHRLNAWARCKDGERAYTLLQTLLRQGTLPNLWDTHPPFQIDGNFGGCAGIAEMLMQSHEKAIALLPACPAAWTAKGQFRGLVARGNFVVDAEWQNNALRSVDIRARAGGPCRITAPGIAQAKLVDEQGQAVTTISDALDSVSFTCAVNAHYHFSDFPAYRPGNAVVAFTARALPDATAVEFTWQGPAAAGGSYRLYQALGSAPQYTLLRDDLRGYFCRIAICAAERRQRCSYRLCHVAADGHESPPAYACRPSLDA